MYVEGYKKVHELNLKRIIQRNNTTIISWRILRDTAQIHDPNPGIQNLIPEKKFTLPKLKTDSAPTLIASFLLR